MSVRIPMRPDGLVSPLTDAEKDCLTWFVLSSCKKEDAYAMFVNPSVKVISYLPSSVGLAISGVSTPNMAMLSVVLSMDSSSTTLKG